MISCALPSGGGTTTFTYGSDGLRRSKTSVVGGVSTTTDFVYDGTMLVRELVVGNGSIQGTYIGELITSVTYFQGPLGPAYRRNDLSGTSPHWYVYNGLGSVVGEVDQLGNLDSYQEYDAYGAPRTYTVVGTPTSRQGYVGQLGHQTDSETGGLIYMQARYYDPSLGRFVSQDPKGNGKNWFVYCDNQPTNEVDQTGDFPFFLVFIIIVAAIGAGFECWQHGWSWGNAALGAVEAVVTSLAVFGGGYLFGAPGAMLAGAGAGALMALLDCGVHGGCWWQAMLLGAVFGWVGGIGGVPDDPEALEACLYIAVGVYEAAAQALTQEIDNF